MMNTTVVPNSQTQATSGDKADIEMAEYTGEHGAVDEVKAGNVVPPSDFVNLNRLQTLRKFWKVRTSGCQHCELGCRLSV